MSFSGRTSRSMRRSFSSFCRTQSGTVNRASQATACTRNSRATDTSTWWKRSIAQSIGHQAILRFHHVDVSVAREFRVHAVAWLARFTVPDCVRQNDEKLRRIERLVLPEKLIRKFRSRDKLCAAAGGTVHDQYGICRFALRVFLWFSQRSIMKTQLRQYFA